MGGSPKQSEADDARARLRNGIEDQVLYNPKRQPGTTCASFQTASEQPVTGDSQLYALQHTSHSLSDLIGDQPAPQSVVVALCHRKPSTSSLPHTLRLSHCSSVVPRLLQPWLDIAESLHSANDPTVRSRFAHGIALAGHHRIPHAPPNLKCCHPTHHQGHSTYVLSVGS